MTKAKFFSDFEGWLKGSPEFEVHIMGQKTTSDSLTRYPRLSLLKLEIFDGEKKLGEQAFKNTRRDWMENFFALSPEAYRGFRPISWMKVGNRRVLLFDNLAEHDSLYGGAFVMCVLPGQKQQ